ncbi:MAG: Glu/Leu/Phe/Val dehydrogenase family protein [Ectothiorhodospiraceae bacterium]|jgi:leucine dehydrogenase
MSVFDAMEYDAHSRVVFHHDPKTGLKAVIALHREWERPCAGGTRLKTYASEQDALEDVLRLSRGMSCKSVMSGLAYGGSKAVIMADRKTLADRRGVFRAMGEFVDQFNGRFRTGVDFGLTVEDVRAMAEGTTHVVGLGDSDPAAATSQGVVNAIRASVAHVHGSGDLAGLTVAVQGLGKVGMGVVRLLHGAGAEVIAADTDESATRKAATDYGAAIVPVERILGVKADVFCPCAVGGILDDSSISSLGARIVAGAANNQLAKPALGEALRRREVLYAPDYVVNAGGLLAVSQEIEGFGEDELQRRLTHIGETLTEVFEHAETAGIDTSAAADRIARGRIDRLDRGLRAAA